MRKLLLVRHSQSQVTPGLAPDLWPLTAEGRARCTPFASRIRRFDPQFILTSEERKARETGLQIGEALALPVLAHPGLHEHVRSAFVEPDTQEEFRRRVEGLFDAPDRLVYGLETANEALARFEASVRNALAVYNDTLVMVSHGTVMSLLVAKYNPVKIKTFWRNLKMPDLVLLDADHFRLLTDR